MNAPHFSTDKTAREAFERHMKPFLRGTGNPLAAVGAVLGAGCSILLSDVPTPLLDAYAKLPDEVAKGHYSRDNATAINNERQALQLVRGQENVRRGHAERAEKAKVDERAAFIEKRVAEKRDAQRARVDAEFRAEAEREAEEKLGAAPAPVPPSEPTEPAPSAEAPPEPEPDPQQLRGRRAKKAA